MTDVTKHIRNILREMEAARDKVEEGVDSEDQSDAFLALNAGQAAAWQAAIFIVKAELNHINQKKERS